MAVVMINKAQNVLNLYWIHKIFFHSIFSQSADMKNTTTITTTIIG